MTLRRELEEKFELQRDDLNEKLKKAQSELATKSKECDAFSSEGKTVSENLKIIQKDLERESTCKKSEISEFQKLLDGCRLDLTNVRAKLEDVEDRKSKLEEILAEKEDYTSRQDVLRLTLEADIKQLRDDLARYVIVEVYVLHKATFSYKMNSFRINKSAYARPLTAFMKCSSRIYLSFDFYH